MGVSKTPTWPASSAALPPAAAGVHRFRLLGARAVQVVRTARLGTGAAQALAAIGLHATHPVLTSKAMAGCCQRRQASTAAQVAKTPKKRFSLPVWRCGHYASDSCLRNIYAGRESIWQLKNAAEGGLDRLR